MNTLTGKKGFYKYDSIENTIQRFNERLVEKKIINNITEENESINMYLIIGIGILAFILLIIVTKALFKPKHKRRK